jgi:hypothetical protein
MGSQMNPSVENRNPWPLQSCGALEGRRQSRLGRSQGSA